MSESLFVETLVTQLPSPSNGRSTFSNKSNGGYVYHCEGGKEPQLVQIDDNDEEAILGRRHKIATKNHSIEIRFDSEAKHGNQCFSNRFSIKVDRLPCIDGDNNGDGEALGGGRSSNNHSEQVPVGNLNDCSRPFKSSTNTISERIESKPKEFLNGEKNQTNECNQCLAHSFCPVSCDSDGNDFFLEAFVLKLNPSLSDDNQHVQIAHNQNVANVSATSRIGAPTGNNNTSNDTNNNATAISTHQPSSDIEKRKEDLSSTAQSDNPTNIHTENLFHLVLKAFLPTKENGGAPSKNDHDCKTKGYKIESEKEKLQTKRTHKKDRGKKQQFNFSLTLPIPHKPMFIKVCKLDSLFYRNDNNEDPMALIIGYGTTLKLFQVLKDKKNYDSDRRIGNLVLKEEKLVTDKSPPTDIPHQDSLISLLLRSPTKDEVTAENKDPLDFDSQLTAIDTIQLDDDNNSKVNYIAIGCQSGNLRIISHVGDICSSNLDKESLNDYSEEKRNVNCLQGDHSHVNTTEFLVDGSVITVSFSIHTENRYIDLIVGTSCGYACLFRKPIDSNIPFQQIPLMIVEGLWNVRKKQDDSILSASKLPYMGFGSGDVVAIGTLSGQVLLFSGQQQNGKKIHFSLLWHTQLHHPIHSITYSLHNDRLFPSLVIITQKSVHLYEINMKLCIHNAQSRLKSIIDIS